MEHDSLEEYLQLSEKISKDANKFKSIVTTAQKRKDCERKALGIVQLFLERSIGSDIFLKSIVYINPSYYEDIVEERALLKLCGYPLCRKKNLKPKNRYSICNKTKKVYDLNEYGNFCSIFCFNASSHIKSQIPDSPLWLRDLEEIPTFSLLVKQDSCAAGIDIKSKKSREEKEFIPISSYAKMSLDDVGNLDFSVPAMNRKEVGSSFKNGNKSKLSTVMENDVEGNKNVNNNAEEKESNNISEYRQVTEKSESKDALTCLESQIVKMGSNDNIVCSKSTGSNNNNNLKSNCKKSEKKESLQNNYKKQPELKDLGSITDKIKKKIHKPMTPLIAPLPLKTNTTEVLYLQENKLENQSETMKNKSLIELKFSFKDSGRTIEKTIKNIIQSWVSLETLIFIHGEDLIKAVLNVNKLSEHFETLKISQLETDQQQKYISICRRLCEQEIFEEKIDSLLVKNNIQSLPNYKQLKQESKEFKMKVGTYFSGDLLESHDTNFGTVEEKQTFDSDKESNFIPLDDLNSQKTLRQQILLKTLKGSIEFFLDYLEYDSSSVLTELNELVKSFKLNAENIVFKLIIRNYLGIICLKILSLKDAKLCQALERIEFLELENSAFQQLPGRKKVLMTSLELIKDIDNFIDNYVQAANN